MDDAVDPDLELDRWPRLRGVLETIPSEMGAVYTDSDRKAGRYQRRHKIFVVVSAVSGSIAILLAIFELPDDALRPISLPDWSEFVAALLALIAVSTGLYSAMMESWLLERHRAERCRLFKYAILTDPMNWTNPPPADLPPRPVFQEIIDLDHDALASWCEEISDFEAREPRAMLLPSETLRDLTLYYKDRRLASQLEYFEKRARDYSVRDKLIRRVVPICFFLSIAAAFAHFTYQIISRHERPDNLTVALTVVAASLPVIGATFRTIRSANEYSRNRTRYIAVAKGIERLKERLDRDLGRGDAGAVFAHLWHCEKIMEEEHREWLRLMLDAEWFG